jgi:hypothetical protein
MNDTHVFKSRHGRLEITPTGITIKRTIGQALQNGSLLKRHQTFSYSDIKDISHHSSGPMAGYLQLTAATGPAFSRHTRLSFDAHQTHEARQAQRLIEQYLNQAHGLPDQALGDNKT